MLTFILLLALAALAAVSLIPLRRRMHPILLAYGYMMASILFDQTYIVLYYNLKAIDAASAIDAFISNRLYAFIVYPVGLAWLFQYLHRCASPLRRAGGLIAFTALAALYDYVLVWAGYVELIHWNPLYSIVRHIALEAILIPSMLGVSRWLRHKEAAL
jgi:hypothetical protein